MQKTVITPPLQSDKRNSHIEIQQLLPWYVNNTLQGKERQRVMLHLGACAECQRERDKLQRWQSLVSKDDLTIQPMLSAFGSLMCRIDVAEQDRASLLLPQKQSWWVNWQIKRTHKATRQANHKQVNKQTKKHQHWINYGAIASLLFALGVSGGWYVKSGIVDLAGGSHIYQTLNRPTLPKFVGINATNQEATELRQITMRFGATYSGCHDEGGFNRNQRLPGFWARQCWAIYRCDAGS